MIRRYRVVLNVPTRHGYWTPTDVGSRRTVEKALRLAERVLAGHAREETRYHSPFRGFDCTIYDAKGPKMPNGRGILVRLTDEQSERTEAPVRIVPSVGELGWTP